MAQEYFELANVLDGSMTPEEARGYYKKSIGELYGVCTCTKNVAFVNPRIISVSDSEKLNISLCHLIKKDCVFVVLSN